MPRMVPSSLGCNSLCELAVVRSLIRLTDRILDRQMELLDKERQLGALCGFESSQFEAVIEFGLSGVGVALQTESVGQQEQTRLIVASAVTHQIAAFGVEVVGRGVVAVREGSVAEMQEHLWVIGESLANSVDRDLSLVAGVQTPEHWCLELRRRQERMRGLQSAFIAICGAQ